MGKPYLVFCLIIVGFILLPVSAGINSSQTDNLSKGNPGHFFGNGSLVLDTLKTVNHGDNITHNIQALLDAGYNQLNNYEWAKAEKTFSNIKTQNPEINEGWEGYLYAKYFQRDLDGVIKETDNAIKTNPDFARGYHIQGHALEDQGDLEGAIAAFDKALAINPVYLDAIFCKGNVLFIQGNYSEAKRVYEKLLEINPQYPQAWMQKGRALYYQNEKILSENNMKYPHKSFAENFNPFMKTGYENALTALNKELEISPEDKLTLESKIQVLKSMSIYNRSGVYDEMLNTSNILIAMDPENPNYWEEKGNALWGLGMKDAAIEAYDMGITYGSTVASGVKEELLKEMNETV